MKILFKGIILIAFVVLLGIIGRMEAEQEEQYYNFCINTYGENIIREINK